MNIKTHNSELRTETLLGVSAAVQALVLPVLLAHTSDGGAILGRYSPRYAAVLAISGGLLLGWLALFMARRRVVGYLSALPDRVRYGLIALSGAAVFAAWFVPVEIVLRETLSLEWLLAALLLIRTVPDSALRLPRWSGWLLGGVVALFLLAMLITALTGLPFSPDDGVWADIAVSPFIADGLYQRGFLDEPFVIAPGRGWSAALYGWLLENVAFDVRIGRLWNFAAYLPAFAGIGAVTARLYGRRAAIISVAFALLSWSFLPIVEYRPDHELPAAGIWIVFAAIQARYSQRPRVRAACHFLAGLGATLSLELHAAGIVFAFGLALFYALEFALAFARQRRLPDLAPLLWFGLGAALGTGIFYALNIAPVGGVQVYLEYLVRTRGTPIEKVPFLRWSHQEYSDWRLLLFESVPIWGGLAYLAWRRSEPDRLYLGMVACVVVGIALLETQGYRTTFNALYVVPVGALISGLMSGPARVPGINRHAALAAACLLLPMAGSLAGLFVDWPTVAGVLRSGQFPPTLYEDLRPLLAPHVRNDDVIVSTPQLIWTFPHQPRIVVFGAEITGMMRWGLSEPSQVWERVQPTAVVFVEGHMHFDPGLQVYMADHAFEVCQRFEVQGHAVELYREDCSSPG